MTPQEIQKKIVSDLYSFGDHKKTASERCRAVAQALWDTTHNHELPHGEMLTALSLISGFAMAVLYDAADALEGKADDR